ncbi:MAG: winged helix-turn-helix domain-containing protein, partial [Candidatus Thorarchaeota archaeon]
HKGIMINSYRCASMDYLDIPLLQAAFTIRQGLVDDSLWPTVKKAIQQIAAVQIDTISVVSRSHHLTLRNRVQNYQSAQLWDSLRNREIFEHSAHAWCFVPIEEYPYYRYRMKRFSTHCNSWAKQLLKKHNKLMDAVENRIRNEGALSSKDFEDPTGKKRTGFWDLKPAKIALNLLLSTGRLAVADRQGFQIIHDLAERVIPSQYLDQHIEQDQIWRYFLKRNLDCLVVATAQDLTDYITFGNFALDIEGNRIRTVEMKLRILEQEDLVMKVEIPKMKRQHYILTSNKEFIEKVQDYRHSSSHVWFLNPFDNVLWNRDRVERVFGVEIKLEAFTPKAQRKFGYYVTPILWQHRIIGRIDPKVDRANNTLILRNIELFVRKNEIPEVIEPLQQELNRFKSFHSVENLQIEKAKPEKLKTILC